MNAILPYLRWSLGETCVCGVVGAYSPPGTVNAAITDEDGTFLTDEDGTIITDEA